MYYSDELVEEIRAKTDIVDVVSQYVKLTKKGSSFWGLCPFHSEKSPSFSVSGQKQMFHCFGCGEGGNVYSFLMKYENYSFPEAVRTLGERAGVQLPENVNSEEEKKKQSRRARLLECNKAAATFFYRMLRVPEGEIGYSYFKKRELSDDTMKKFGLGYSGKSGKHLVEYLKKQGFEDDIIKEVGLATYSEKNGLSSQFWNRVMFPIQDINHRVIGFGGRVMGEGEPKYLNSPETPIFDKRRNLYGMNFARTSRSGDIIICEGYMDVIAMHQAGFTQAVASLGTAFTEEQAALIHRYTDKVYLAYDSDGPGVKAALRNIGILRNAGITGKVINMRPYKDPDEFMKNLGAEAFQERIRDAENSFFFEIRILSEKFDMKDPESKTKFHREIARKLCEFEDDDERENYLQAIADRYGIGFDNMRKLVLNYATATGGAKPVERPATPAKGKLTQEDKSKRSQRLLLTWLADEPNVYGKIKKYLSVEDFTDELYRQVAEKLLFDMEQGKYDPAAIVDMFDEEGDRREVSLIFNTNLPELENVRDREKALRDILLNVKTSSYEYYTARLGADVNALNQVIAGKKALEELAKADISLS